MFFGMGFLPALALIFIALQLTGVIAWSWWLVLAPLWAPIAVCLAIWLVGVLLLGVAAALSR